jgi:hypothetical protein
LKRPLSHGRPLCLIELSTQSPGARQDGHPLPAPANKKAPLRSWRDKGELKESDKKVVKKKKEKKK